MREILNEVNERWVKPQATDAVAASDKVRP